jgi:hypothetical protein
MTRTFTFCLLILTTLLTGCGIMEGVHQTSPNYKRPVPFSSNWWEKKKAQDAYHQFKREWGVRE